MNKINKILFFNGLIVSLKKTIIAKATKNVARFVRGLPAVTKNVDCDIKKKEARNACNSPRYFFDMTYIANGLKEQIDTYTPLKRNS
jgi:hypothetical protein